MDDKEPKDLKARVAVLENYIRTLETDLIHDHLTSLKTRAFFGEEIGVYLTAISNADTTSRREFFGFKNVSVLFFDIDHFKKVNDTYTHDKGDMVLREIARTILLNVREGDTVARWGGEEIVVSLLGANEQDAKNKAEEIRKKVEALSFDFASDLKVTVSVGVANTQVALTCSELVSRADKALYKAKEMGRNRVVVYSEI